ncbi:hypothetical protein H5410_021468 [Solanum commersonii]|uniref:Uncharacterized protein n=1 Tax=Solanum commersonii TaxID=4109 RepID=A0A9J5ZB37_SOLCO|nr:hypothetical protein H5410_021468 [Solanum commersonii]
MQCLLTVLMRVLTDISLYYLPKASLKDPLMNDLNSLIHNLYNCNNNRDINANVTCMMKMLSKFL